MRLDLHVPTHTGVINVRPYNPMPAVRAGQKIRQTIWPWRQDIPPCDLPTHADWVLDQIMAALAGTGQIHVTLHYRTRQSVRRIAELGDRSLVEETLRDVLATIEHCGDLPRLDEISLKLRELNERLALHLPESTLAASSI